ncbi:MAG: purine-binding chemotaxis protein CheW [Chromatiaceae bacterium]|nr:purine-binding chemotaxis protein CheW [Chromatiaceae bacterium]
MNTESNSAAVLDDDEANGTQYLTFLLADEQYAVNILQVQEIRGWEQVTRIPNSPDYVKGVINLRGTIVPVVDLRLRFQLPPEPYGKETVVIVVRTTFKNGTERSLGMVVDAVSDVLVARDDRVIGTPDFGANVPTENILGLVSQNDEMVMVLDVMSLLEQPSGAEEVAA